MPYFKDQTGMLYFLSEQDILNLNGDLSILPTGCEQITDEESYAIQNPPPTAAQVLASQSQKLLGFVSIANSQKTALTNRIEVLQDAINNVGVEGAQEFAATPAEQDEFTARKAQLTKWKNYSIALGRVTSQPGWAETVVWPTQPTSGMDLTISSVESTSV